MTKYSQRLLIVAAALTFLLSQSARAQNTHTYSTLDYDNGTGRLTGQAYTSVDYNAQPYYTVGSNATLKDENNNVIAYSPGGNGQNTTDTATVQANGTDSTNYTLTGTHILYTRYQEQPYYTYGDYTYYWNDYWNNRYLESNRIPPPGYPGIHDFLAPGPKVYNYDRNRIIGFTNASVTAGQTPTTIQLTTFGAKQTHNGDSITDGQGTVLAPVAYGYSRLLIYTVLDQRGRPINKSGYTAEEVAYIVQRNPPRSPGLPNPVLNEGALSAGTFRDVQAWFFDAPPPPRPGEYLKAKQYLNIKTAGHAWALRVNCLNLQYDDVTVTQTTSEATCQ